MTERKSDFLYRYILLSLAVFLIAFSFSHLREMLLLVNSGIRVSVLSVIPSLFPFMIFSDMLLYSDIFEKLPKKANKLFEKAFKIRQDGLGAFLTGIICGFPLGVKYACDLYKSKRINKDELERLICFCNNTGPAFLLAGIGISMRGSILDGIILYVVQIASALLCGMIISHGKECSKPETCNAVSTKGSFNLTESIKKSSLNMLYVCAFVVFFSIVCGYFKILVPNALFSAIFTSFFEIGNAAIACNVLENRILSLVITAGAVSFSGMSVHLQAEIFYGEYEIDRKRYYFAKLFQSALSMLLTYLISLLTYFVFTDKI